MKKKKVSELISSLLIFLLCIGILGVFFRFSNGFEEEFKSFYVTYDGKAIFATESELYFSHGKDYRFDVKYTFEFSGYDETETKGYSVKIVPNVEDKTDFMFMVDGEEYLYSNVTDLTKGFEIDKQDSYFVLSITDSMSLESVLEMVYGKDVEFSTGVSRPSGYLYTLMISSYDESVMYYIDFAFSLGATGIKLDINEVVF